MTTYLISLCKKNFHLFLIFFIVFLIANSFTFYVIDIILYILLHILFVFWSFYERFKLNYYITFILAFILDLALINNFGPHLIIFMFIFLIIGKINNFFNNKNPLYSIIFNILIIYSMLLTEKLLAYFLYDININYIILFKYFIFLIILYYPVYLLLNIKILK